MARPVIYKNITVITPTLEGGVKCSSEMNVAVLGSSIIYVGNDYLLAKRMMMESLREAGSSQAGFDEYGGQNRILLPTFANGHSHIPMVLFRNTSDDKSLHDWLFNVIIPREMHWKREGIFQASLLGIAEMINGGTGASSDMYFMAEETARAALQSGFRCNLCHEGKSNDKNGWKTDPLGLKDFKDMYHNAGGGLLRTSLMIHSVYLYPYSFYSDLVAEAADIDVSIQIHVSETEKEVLECIEKNKVSPVQALADFGVFDRPCIAAHCVHLDDNDRDILSASKVTVAHNPSSNMKLASGRCDVQSLINKGVNVCLGTDGSASNNNMDMYQEMRLASFIAKSIRNNPTDLCAKDVLYMATRGGYNGSGFEKCGLIMPGMQADIQIVNYDNPSMWPLGNPISALVYSAPSSAVESVMIAGKFVKYRGQLTTIDIEKVKAETKKYADEINQY